MTDKMRIVIVGGVAGGASAATKARRLSENAEIILIERGADISYANCGLPYHIGGIIEDRKKLLVQTPASLNDFYNLDIRVNTEATKIDTSRKEITLKDLVKGSEYNIAYDKLILSPGAEALIPPISGVNDSRVKVLRTLADMDAIIKIIDENKVENAVIVGGGYIGLEMAESLRHRNIDVSLVELTPQVMGPIDVEMAAPVHQQLKLHGVDLRLETSVTGFESIENGIRTILNTGESIDCGLVIMAAGVKPETRLAREAGLKIGERGGIAVDSHMQTSDTDIFAVGDAVEVTDFVGGFQSLIPLAGPANRQGRIAAENIFGKNVEYKNTQGTGICKVFDLSVAMTGMNEKTAKRIGKSYEKIYIHPASNATYYPGASPMSIKLLFDPNDGKILGAQIVGISGVDKRIDVIAVAIRAGLTVFDLEEMELSYAPPYGSAKDPINYAGFVASNVLRGDVKICHIQDVIDPNENQILLDVRKPFEVQAGTIPGALNIPLGELRNRISELPKEKEILVFCQVGMRGYLACRILSQLGYKCRNLTGGYKTYSMYVSNLPNITPPTDEKICDDTGAVCHNSSLHLSKDVVSVVKLIDACGLQCPGPIMRVSQEIEHIKDGEAISILSTDPGFLSDIGPWCNITGNTLVEVVPDNGKYKAIVMKGGKLAAEHSESALSKKKTIVVFSCDFDKIVAAFVIANGAAAMGSKVTLFFTFWGLNVLRKPEGANVSKNLIEKMFGWMMPRGADKLSLSKMNMAGMGLAMIKGIMKKKNVPTLHEFIESAKNAGVRLVVCTMSMDLMGIKKEELIDGVEFGGVAMYLEQAESGNVNLFI